MEAGFLDGKTIILGEGGSFSINISTSGGDAEVDVTVANISRSKVLFRPAKELKVRMDMLVYQKQNVSFFIRLFPAGTFQRV